MAGWTKVLVVPFLLGLGPGEGQIFWARSWESALEEARIRNVPIFITFLKDGCPGSVAMTRDTLPDEMLTAYLNEVTVPVAAHTADVGMSHEPEEFVDPLTGKESLRCPIYKTISCLDHDRLHSKVRALLRVKGTPKSFVLGPDGKPFGGSGEVTAEPRAIIMALRQAQKKLGKPLRRSIYLKSRERIETGRRAFEGEEFATAIRALKGVAGDGKSPEGMREEANRILSLINAKGIELVGAARRVFEEDPEKGRRLLRDLRVSFRGLEAAKSAKRALGDLKRAPVEDRDG